MTVGEVQEVALRRFQAAGHAVAKSTDIDVDGCKDENAPVSKGEVVASVISPVSAHKLSLVVRSVNGRASVAGLVDVVSEKKVVETKPVVLAEDHSNVETSSTSTLTNEAPAAVVEPIAEKKGKKGVK